MSSAWAAKKSQKKTPKARLPPKRGQVKVRIFSWVAKKLAGVASTIRARKGEKPRPKQGPEKAALGDTP